MNIFERFFNFLFPPVSMEKIKKIDKEAKLLLAKELFRQLDEIRSFEEISSIYRIDSYLGTLEDIETIRSSVRRGEFYPNIQLRLKEQDEKSEHREEGYLTELFKIIAKDGSEFLSYVAWDEEPRTFWTEKLDYQIPNPSGEEYKDVYLVYDNSKNIL